MYKDKDKQREANRRAQAKFKAKGIGITEGITEKVLPEHNFNIGTDSPVIPCKPEAKPKTTRLPTHKRGKDIKCFEDLPADVQETIDRMSMFNGKIDRAIKIKRTAAAIRYQHNNEVYERNYHS